jgi:glucosamine--fructose-6-phosphate aminotransferase (isomerizing)
MSSAVSNPGSLTWSELIAQPDAWEALLKRLADRNGFPRLDLSSYDEIVLVGSGTSYYLAMAVGDWIKRRHDVPLRAVPSCEIMLDDYETRPRKGKRLAIGFSRSGSRSRR